MQASRWRIALGAAIASVAVVACTLVVGPAAWAGPAGVVNQGLCHTNGQLYDGRVPVLGGGLPAHTYRVCFSAYNTMYSGIAREPLWSAEHLTRARLGEHRGVHRTGNFHDLAAIPAPYRNPLSAYTHNAYDRGHMAPAGDMPSTKAMSQSFTMVNITAQQSHDNRYLWEGIESSTRALAKSFGSVYVVSGPVFAAHAERLKTPRGPLIPAYFFKAIYAPSAGKAAAYVVTNTRSNAYSVVSIKQLREWTGLDPFPAMSAPVATQSWTLPAPTPHGDALGNRYRVPLSGLEEVSARH